MRVLAALRKSLSLFDLYAEIGRLRKELVSRELTVHMLLATSEQYNAGLAEGQQHTSRMIGRLLAAAREFIDGYKHPSEVTPIQYADRFAELEEATDALEAELYGDVDVDEDEDPFAGLAD